jgi:glyoxylase-like metal-dependent hydrolase (beta-lactamase superfamily II)
MARVQVGNVEIVALSDGSGAYAGERVYPSAGEALPRHAHHLDAEGRVPLNFGCFLLRADGRTVLVDTGNGPEADGTLMAQLTEAGVQPADIDTVVFTHLHGDHTGWNLQREDGQPRFARARYLVPRGDWDHGVAQDREGGSFNRDVRPLEALGALDLIVVRSGGQEAYILGDAFLSPIDVEEIEWASSWDGDAETTVRTRKMLAQRIEASDALIGASHLPAPGLGRFVVVDGRRTWRGVTLA